MFIYYKQGVQFMSVIIIYLKKLEKNLMLKGKNNTISATKANTLTMLIKQFPDTHKPL